MNNKRKMEKKMKNALDGFSNRVEILEKQIPENESIRTSKIKKEKEQRLEETDKNVQRLLGQLQKMQHV
jgi:hypothetical protein